MAALAAILLAAGESQRFGGENKLLAPIADRPLVRGLAQQILDSGVADVMVVTGCVRPQCRAEIVDNATVFADIDTPRRADSGSIYTGAGTLGLATNAERRSTKVDPEGCHQCRCGGRRRSGQGS